MEIPSTPVAFSFFISLIPSSTYSIRIGNPFSSSDMSVSFSMSKIVDRILVSYSFSTYFCHVFIIPCLSVIYSLFSSSISHTHFLLFFLQSKLLTSWYIKSFLPFLSSSSISSHFCFINVPQPYQFLIQVRCLVSYSFFWLLLCCYSAISFFLSSPPTFFCDPRFLNILVFLVSYCFFYSCLYTSFQMDPMFVAIARWGFLKIFLEFSPFLFIFKSFHVKFLCHLSSSSSSVEYLLRLLVGHGLN